MITPHLKSRIHEDVCVLLEFDNHALYYLLDCGFASDLTVSDCKNIDAIFVTHTHIDHFSNFDQIMRHQIGLGRTIVICGPEGIARQVAAKLQGFTWNLLEEGDARNVTYEVREIRSGSNVTAYRIEAPEWKAKEVGVRSDSDIFANEKFKVSCCLLDHGTPCVAYRFDEHPLVKINMKDCPHVPGPWVRDLKNAFAKNEPSTRIEVGQESLRAEEMFVYLETLPGSSFGFVMDHAATEPNHLRIVNLIRDADEVWIEAFFTELEADLAEKNRHSTARASGAVCRRSRVKKAIPIHFSRRYHQEAELELLKAEFAAGFGPVS